MVFTEAVAQCYSKFLVFEGRASRSEYWWFRLFIAISAFIQMILFKIFPLNEISFNPGLAAFAIIFFVLPDIAVTIRRLHDRGISGYWLLPQVLIPALGALSIFMALKSQDEISASHEQGLIQLGLLWLASILAILICCLLPSSDGENRYGPNPFQQKDPTTTAETSYEANKSVGLKGSNHSPVHIDAPADEVVPALGEKTAERPAIQSDKTERVLSEAATAGASLRAKSMKVFDYSAAASAALQKVPTPESALKISWPSDGVTAERDVPDLAPQLLRMSPDPRLVSRAKLVIEYSEEASRTWREVEKLPASYQDKFLKRLEEDSAVDFTALLDALLEDRRKELRPYEDDAANTALEDARTISPEAESEFKEVYSALGSRANLELVIEKIESRFGQTARTKARLAVEREEAERKDREAQLAAEQEEAERKARLAAEREEVEREDREARLAAEQDEAELAEAEREEAELAEAELAEVEREEAERRDREANRPLALRIFRRALSLFWHLTALNKLRTIVVLAMIIAFLFYY